MLRKACHRHTKENRLLRLVLAFALVFAALHVSLHDMDVEAAGPDHQCQVCRLNQMPAASVSPSLLLAPLLVLAFVAAVPSDQYHPSILSRVQWARAPPLF